jgi:hypothetical protein
VVATGPFSSPGGDAPPVAVPSGDSPVWPAGPGALCAYPSRASTQFAFDGTVTGFGANLRYDDYAAYAEVTFQVNEWLHGGDAEQFTVVMTAPNPDTYVYIPIDYGIGSRLLIAASWWDVQRLDHPFTGQCGYMVYDPDQAQIWHQNFDVD